MDNYLTILSSTGFSSPQREKHPCGLRKFSISPSCVQISLKWNYLQLRTTPRIFLQNDPQIPPSFLSLARDERARRRRRRSLPPLCSSLNKSTNIASSAASSSPSSLTSTCPNAAYSPESTRTSSQAAATFFLAAGGSGDQKVRAAAHSAAHHLLCRLCVASGPHACSPARARARQARPHPPPANDVIQ